MKDKKISLIYQYEDGDKGYQNIEFSFLKNCTRINKRKRYFHADFYDVLRGIDEEDENYSITRIGINKRIKDFK